MAPLRVLQVGAFVYPHHQGSQVYVDGMCRALAAAGADVHLATYGGGVGVWPPAVRPVPVTLPQTWMPRRSGPHWTKPSLDLALAAAVATALRRQHFDVVHAHNVEAPWIARLARVLSGRRVPLVYNLHTSLGEELPTYVEGARTKRVLAQLGRWHDHAVPRVADACVALSTRACEHLQAHGARRVAWIPPGVDLAPLLTGDAGRARERWQLGAGDWVLYAGNTDTYQDLTLLVEAMALVPQAGLLVVTSSPATDVWQLAARARPAQARVRVVQSTDLADLADALAVATLGSVPRRVCTGFPIKLLNLLGAGVVTVAATGSVQAIAGCVDGGMSAASMAAVIAAYLADSKRRETLSHLARAEVATSWTWEARASELLQFYATLR